MEERPQVEFGKRSTHKVSQALYDQIRWNAVCGESCTHGVEPGKSWRSYQRLTYGYLAQRARAKAQGMKQLMAGGGVALIGITLVPLLSGLFG